MQGSSSTRPQTPAESSPAESSDSRSSNSSPKYDVMCALCCNALVTLMSIVVSGDGWETLFGHLTITELKQSALYGGCHICNIMLGTIQRTRFLRGEGCSNSFALLDDELRDISDHLLISTPFFDGFSMNVVSNSGKVEILPLCGTGSHKLDDDLTLDSLSHEMEYIGSIQCLTDPDIRPIRRRMNTMSIASSVRSLQEWIHECDSGHPSRKAHRHPNRCSKISQPGSRPLPTRLLEISGDSSAMPKVRLRQSTDLESTAKYNTLSYCWGGDVRGKCTPSNIHAYFHSIPFDTIPRTVQDAISLTQMLGVHYLWVDAFCIIQGSKADWEAEAYHMIDVYSQSHLNIAADASSDAEGGLFKPGARNELALTVCEIPAYVGPEGSLPKTTCSRARLAQQPKPPLWKRAWALQERLISPRTVHFGQEEMHWECSTSAETESGVPFACLYPEYNADIIATLSGSPGLTHECVLWADIVLDYSEADLSEPTDKLVALAGLALKFANNFSYNADEYIAGLWKRHLIYGLLWTHLTAQAHISQVDGWYNGPYRAPSWSWASVDGSIRFLWSYHQKQITSTYAELVEAKIEPPNRPFGLLNDGYVRLKAPVGRFLASEWAERIGYACQHCYLSLATGVVVWAQVTIDQRPNNRLFQDAGEDSDLPPLVTVPLLLLDLNNFDTRDCDRVAGLILERTDTKRGQYRRLGAFLSRDKWRTATTLTEAGGRKMSITDDDDDDDDDDVPFKRDVVVLVAEPVLLRAATSDERRKMALQEYDYLERDEQGLCTIEIV